MKDAADFAAFNKVYAEYFDSDHPACTTLEAKLMIDIKVEVEVEVEVEAVAYKPSLSGSRYSTAWPSLSKR